MVGMNGMTLLALTSIERSPTDPKNQSRHVVRRILTIISFRVSDRFFGAKF